MMFEFYCTKLFYRSYKIKFMFIVYYCFESKNSFLLFSQQTGIMEMRAAMQEKEDAKTLKSKQRGKVTRNEIIVFFLIFNLFFQMQTF